MKHLPAIILAAAAVLFAHAPAQAAPILDFAVRVGCDFQQPERGLMDLHVLQGSTPLVLAMPKAGNTALTPDMDTSVRMIIGPSDTGSIYAVRTNYAIAGGGYAIDWPTIGTNSSGQAWFYTLLFDREGKTYWSGSGALYIDASGYTGPDGVEWIEYTTPNVGWANVVGDPADNAALVQYVEDHGGGIAVDATARAGVVSNAADIATLEETVGGITAESLGALTEEEDAAALSAVAAVSGRVDTVEGWGDHAEAGYLTEEADAAALAAIEDLSSNKLDADVAELLYQPVGDYPTGDFVRVETDAIALAAAPTNVFCAGGYYYPDYFSLETSSYVSTYESFGATSDYNSVSITLAEYSAVPDLLIQPTIARQQDWTGSLAFSEEDNVELAEFGEGQWLASWLPETAAGATGSFVAVLGDYSRAVQFVRGTVGTVSTVALWRADVDGSLRAAINSQTLAAASATGKSQSLYSPWPYSTTNFIRNTNVWTTNFNLTCASPWNSFGLYYRPGTAVTPQHVLGAAHWFAPTGTTFRFIDATNGVHERTLVDRRFLPGDVAVGLLDSPLGQEISPATIFAAGDVSYLRGRYGLRDAPGVYLVALDAQERAWLCKTPKMERTSWTWDKGVSFYGSTNLPLSRYESVGGDSGNPVFACWGTNVVLVSCFYTATGGPFYPTERSAIEAAMADMGGSVYTNLPAPDLSAWPNYDSGAEPPDL